MTIKQILAQAYRQLEAGRQNARLDAQVLLCHTLNCNSAKLMAWSEQILTDEQQQNFLQLIKQRQQGHPVAYLTGHKEFWSLDLKVTPDTLIPRPETELLVETILQKYRHHRTLMLADLGTGSGAIACALAREKPNWQITATDISTPALTIAQHNAQRHHLHNIRFKHGDWFAALPRQAFDIIVSNPPYIASNDKHLSEGDVRFEPTSALIAGTDGMESIQYLCKHAAAYLKPTGLLIFEHGYGQQQPVLNCLQENTYNNIFQKKDLSGHVRVSGGNITTAPLNK